MVESKHLSINGVSVDVICNHLESVGMHKQRVALREIDGHSTIGTKGKAGLFPIFAIVAGKFIRLL